MIKIHNVKLCTDADVLLKYSFTSYALIGLEASICDNPRDPFKGESPNTSEGISFALAHSQALEVQVSDHIWQDLSQSV